MTDKSSVFSKGGGGTNFEQYIQTAFLTTFIVKGNAPCIAASEIDEIAFQVNSKGYATDDLLAIVKSATNKHRLLLQIKYNITFSDKSNLFKKVMSDFWKDFNNSSLFDKTHDRLIIVKSGLNDIERNHIKVLLNWAKAKATVSDFIAEVNLIDAKQQRLQIFRNVLTEISGSPISDNELWEFLKCLEVLEYDFLNSGSVDEAYFLNLIKLSKNSSATANEKEIWESIHGFAAKLNKDAGSITSESIKREDIYSYFDLTKSTSAFKSIKKLKNDSLLILHPFKNTIGGMHLDKTILLDSIERSVIDFQFTIITGKAGTGKSAIVKELLLTQYSTNAAFGFRADQFNVPHLAAMLSSQGINESMTDLFSCISLIPDKIIFIDSLEKLLEGDSENSFKQFHSLLKQYPNIKVIATSRSYAIDLIIQKFGIEKRSINKIEILTLNDDEINFITSKVPLLIPLIKNKNIRSIISSPKYLDFTISLLQKTNDDYSNITQIDFKKKLWSNIIEDVTTVKDGLSRKRGRAFSNIALKRAKNMKLFVEPDNDIDDKAIEALLNDDVIFRDGEEYQFAPSHDILEDWALIKFIDDTNANCEKLEEIFTKIGNEPAIRRAFRLWVEDYLMDNQSKIIQLIRSTIKNPDIEKYWADELLIAIFKSENCAHFFEAFEKQLLEDNAKFLNRCLLLIRTACKESLIDSSTSSNVLIPTGSGWCESLKFINKHLLSLDNIRLTILNLLADWEYLLLFTNQCNEDEKQYTKNIILTYLLQIKRGDSFWENDTIENKVAEIIFLIYNLADVAQKEIADLINEAIEKRGKDEHWRLNYFFDLVIKYALSGVRSGKLAKEIPQVLIASMWKIWKKAPPKEEMSRFGIPYRADRDDCWGISDHMHFFPSGIYKTCIYKLLIWNPLITTKFIVEFINYSIETYCGYEHEYKKDIQSVKLTLNDGTEITQLGSWELWASYRGLSVTHYLLECILMSLEKYLLELAQIKTESSKTDLRYIFNYLLKKSNSVAITSVLNSIAIAYPEELEDDFLPLLTAKEFYKWDFERGMQEFQVLAPMDNEISFAQRERWESNQLPHRKYTYGLYTFIIDFQFKRTQLNSKIHAIFDKLTSEADTSDILWLKKLNEVDIRKWEAVEYNKDNNAFLIQPKYENEVKKFVESNQPDKITKDTSASYATWIGEIYKEPNPTDSNFNKWIECYNYYISLNTFDYVLDRPKTFSIIGLRDFSERLSKHQKDWCIEQLSSAIITILQDTHRLNYDSMFSINLMEKEIVLKSFHLLLTHAEDKEEYNFYIELIIHMLFAPFGEHEVDRIVEYVRWVLFKQYPEIISTVWSILISFANYRKGIPVTNRFGDVEKRTKVAEEEQQFIKGLIANTYFDVQIKDLSFDSYDSYILARVFAITPYNNELSIYQEYISKFITLLLSDLELKEDYSYNFRKDSRQLNYHEQNDAIQYISELLLNSNQELIEKTVDVLYASTGNFSKLNSHQIKDIVKFIKNIFEYAIYKLEDYINQQRDNYEKSIDNFWIAWEYLFSNVSTKQNRYFDNILLLNTEHPWDVKLNHWLPFEKNKIFYPKVVEALGKKNIKALLNILSTIGEKYFLPDGVLWVASIIKEAPNVKFQLATSSGERFIQRLYYNHITAIKSQKRLLNDYIYILDNMVDLGSSQAYLIRENVITYKST